MFPIVLDTYYKGPQVVMIVIQGKPAAAEKTIGMLQTAVDEVATSSMLN